MKEIRMIVLDEMNEDDSFKGHYNDKIEKTYTKLEGESKKMVDDIFTYLCGYGLETIISMSKKKEFVVGATPNQETWCQTDKDEYKDQLNDGEFPSIVEYYDVQTSEEALDLFHREYPIKCLDDWDIDAAEMNPKVNP